MLRDVLCRIEALATWPCDEINYIWRHGNVGLSSDELPADCARSSVRQYIRKQFEWVVRRYSAHFVVEKTCANCLRIPFVDTVVPEAKYVFIRRDGVDAVASAMSRWHAPMEAGYLARKSRFVPLTDLPYYGLRFLWNRAYRLWSPEKRLASWGPRLSDMERILAEHPLEEVSAIQWKRCTQEARSALQKMSPNRWIEVQYERFVASPEGELERLLGFLGIDAAEEQRREAVKGVSPTSVGKGRAALSEDVRRRVEAIVKEAQEAA
jgi:hypothetical protein